MSGPVSARGFVVGGPPWHTMVGLGWKSVGLLELTALPSIGAERWVPWVREADVLLVDGGLPLVGDIARITRYLLDMPSPEAVREHAMTLEGATGHALLREKYGHAEWTQRR